MMKKAALVALATLFIISSVIVLAPRKANAENAISSRVVLAQFFTNVNCDPCVGADEAISDLADEYKTRLALLEYHVNTVGTDPFTIDACNDTWDYYIETGTKGTPDMFFDGVIEEPNGGDETDRYDKYKEVIEDQLAIDPYYDIYITSEITGNRGTVVVNLRELKTSDVGNLKVKIVVFEDNIHYTGGNDIDIQRFVVRAVLPNSTLSSSITKTFTIQSDWNKNELGVVVYIQSDNVQKTETILNPLHRFNHHKVLQASICKFGVSLTTDKNSQQISPGGTAQFTLQVKNIESNYDTFELDLTKLLPSGWEVSLCTGDYCYPSGVIEVQLNNNESVTIELTVESSSSATANEQGIVIFSAASTTNPYIESVAAMTITLTTTPIPTPVQISIKSVTKSAITLSWSANTDTNFIRYEIHKGAVANFTVSIATLVENITTQTTASYVVTGLAQDTEYYFKIRVVNEYGVSDSNEVHAKTSKSTEPKKFIPGFDAVSVLIGFAVILLLARKKRLS